MSGNEQQLWKSQKEEPMRITAEEACVLARKYGRESTAAQWGAWAVTLVLVGGFIYDLGALPNSWIVAGLAWALAAYIFMVWELLRRGTARMTPEEPCVVFLRRELEGKRRALRRIRWGLALLAPGIAMVVWGRGPGLGVKFIAIALAIGFCWFSFWHQGQKVDREIERLGAI
jgi:hypothetical protein